jgi:DNA-binding winged helix-turn-helix (wHTH) protein
MQTADSDGSKCASYRFDTFEVSVRQRMLRQRGERLKIQELPFQMLLVLLESPGEIVSKEELGKRLWGEETFVEVDKSLYVMAGKLREVLGDNANQPRFIKTISGRGYRFIGEVTPVFLPKEKPFASIPAEDRRPESGDPYCHRSFVIHI